MKKIKPNCTLKAMLLIGLIVCMLPSIGIKIAIANEASVNRWTSYAWPSQWNTYWPDEEDVTEDTVSYIYSLYNSLDYELNEYQNTSDVSSSEVYSTADSMDDYTYATVFQYMHGSNYTETGWVKYYSIPQYSVDVEHYQGFAAASDYIYDHELYDYTGNGHHYFVFMWTCASAKQIGYYDQDMPLGGSMYYEGTGPVGWAYAWTHQDDSVLSDDGYGDADSTDYCFIGFETFSPPLSNVTGYSNKLLSDFVEAFYYSALISGDSINEALDYASSSAYGENYFSNTILYDGWGAWLPAPISETWNTEMEVFGNGDNFIPTG
ncbi:MAG: hypothetical protein NWF02_04655 [Candidatus Bathyarchaeota archaeon]|nr:hypothetical protein [Candidatus Bathyarchaeum sp.]